MSTCQQERRDLAAGLEQISQLLHGTQLEAAEEQAQQQPLQEMVTEVIAKFFEMQNSHEAQLITKQHEIDLLNLQHDNAQTKDFDLELAQSERDYLQQDLQELAAEHHALQTQQAEVRAQLQQC